MKSILFLFVFSCITLVGQENFNYYEDLSNAEDQEDYNKIIVLSDNQLKYSKDSISIARCFRTKANAYYNMDSLEISKVFIEKSIAFSKANSWSSILLRGDISLREGARVKACEDFHLANQYYSLTSSNKHMFIEKRIASSCDTTWHYDKEFSSYYLDTNLFKSSNWPYYKGCYKKVTDTLFSCKFSNEKVSTWKMYYDKKLTILKGKKEIFKDTTKTTFYYPNGAKKYEDWEIKYNWLYHADYCENGNLITEYSPNRKDSVTVKRFHCDGSLKFTALWEAGRFFGEKSHYYPNGQLKKIIHLNPYSKRHEARLKKEQIVKEEFDSLGNTITLISDTPHYNINILGAPTITSNYLDKIKNLYKMDGLVTSNLITNQAGYSKFMTELKTAIYKKCKVNFKTECSCGESHIELVVDEKGKIRNVRVTRSNRKNIDDMFLKAISKLKKWEPGEVNGVSKNVLIQLNLQFEEVK
jgi:predicted negative regulator of RcsB-dependent stress response